MKSNSLEESDSSSVEFEDNLDISLLPDRKHYRRKRIRDSKFVCRLWQMFGGKNAAYGVATAVLLVSVFLIVAFARPSSSYETVNKNSRKNSHYEQAKKPSTLGHGKEDKGSHSLRLPRHLTPIEYLLYLHPNLTKFNFFGKVDILLLCHETSTNITLHVGTKMDYSVEGVARVEGENILETITVTETSRLSGEMVVISLASELQKGSHYFLVMRFKSKLSRGLAGFYLSRYNASDGTRYLATTHFEPTDARNAFPCFDEPNMKAKFTIVITREKRHVALANMPLNYTEGCNSDVELCTDHFQKSVDMSTYLVAFVVCDFNSITSKTSKGVQVSVWAPPEQIDQGQFALDVAVKVLEYYEQIFKVDYPLPKQDLIAIPDFSAGAMENWGLITYRLTSLLYDEGKSSDSNKQWVAVVVAHELAHQMQETGPTVYSSLSEKTRMSIHLLLKKDLIAIPDFSMGAMENWGLITFRLTSILYNPSKSSDSNRQWVTVVVSHELAHQWFGNLVTMEWWNDLWLNEGFASFMENVGVRHVRPEWKMMDQFFLSKFQVAMGLDQLSNSHPIMAEVRDPAEISSLFDSISYDKGAAIIRMLEDVLGSKLFFQGLQNYLNKYKFSNAETNDLWQCLTDEVKESGVSLDVTEMMTTWTSQMGFPVIDVTVERDANGNIRLQYRQERFLVHPGTSSPSDSAYRWVIPLTYVTQQNPSKRHVELLKRQADNVLLRGVSPNTVGNFWIKMNAGQSGYYRVNYDEGNWNSLKEQLNSDHTQLIGADRAGLLDDALNLARAGNLSYNLALDLTAYLSKEQEYVPWISALNGMAYFASQFSTYDMEKNTQYYRIYKLYILIQIHRIASELGWKETDLDPHLKRYLRATILHLASDYEDVFPDDRPYTKEALRQFDGWLNRGESIRPNLRNVVYSLGVKYADIKTWQKVFERFRKEQVATEKRKLMYALTSSRNPQILKSFLQDSLDPKKIRSQDSVAVINSIAHNPEGRLLAWEFVQKNYDLLFNRYGKGSFEFSRLIKATTAHFNTETKLREVKKFFKDKDTGSGKLALLQSLESIEANAKWLNAHRLTVVAWLKNFVSSHVHSPVDSPHHHVHVTSLDERYKYGRP